ncbi:MAG: hypothetical protein QOJ82_715 [Solirubrobacteraceae bacterium]|jgi:hypothetical protein|nr:hypothetical protein [Solirubrobacteraceae bacterium]
MPEPRAQRTLVKSPPELWAEVSDVQALARHLGEFGEIRITRLEPETAVAWEGDRARGTVELEPSGWGTKVTLTAALREGTAPKPVAAPEPEAAPEPVAAPEPEAAAVREDEPAVEEVASAAQDEAPEATAEPAAAEPPRPGLFARLFRRRREAPAPVDAQAIAPEAPEPEVVEPDPEPVAAVVEPDPEPVAAAVEPEPEVTPEPEVGSERLDGDRAVAILTAVLDDLGAAHHRPFSRG